MKQFKYIINGNVYNVSVNQVEDTTAEVEVNGTPYKVKMDKPAKKEFVTIKRPAQAPTTTTGAPVVQPTRCRNLGRRPQVATTGRYPDRRL